MKIDISSLIKSFPISLVFLFLLPFLSSAQSLPPIPDVGEGECVFNCPVSAPAVSATPTPTPTPDTGGTPSISPTSLPSPNIQTHLQSARDLNKQALKELDEEKYIEASDTIDDTIESLNNAKNSLKTDPIILEMCKSNPKALKIFDRSIQSSINNHTKAASAVERIIIAPSVSEDEGLLQKLRKIAIKFLERRIPPPRTPTAVCAVRG